MINRVVLVGRLTKDVELRKTTNGISTATFNLACNRAYTNEETDFIQCVAWRQAAEYLNQYARKGNVIGIDGHIQTRNYDGKYGKVYVTEVIAEQIRILNNTQHKETSEEPKATQKDSFRVDEVNEETDNLPFY